jgi:hypothetical protein
MSTAMPPLMFCTQCCRPRVASKFSPFNLRRRVYRCSMHSAMTQGIRRVSQRVGRIIRPHDVYLRRLKRLADASGVSVTVAVVLNHLRGNRLASALSGSTHGLRLVPRNPLNAHEGSNLIFVTRDEQRQLDRAPLNRAQELAYMTARMACALERRHYAARTAAMAESTVAMVESGRDDTLDESETDLSDG